MFTFYHVYYSQATFPVLHPPSASGLLFGVCPAGASRPLPESPAVTPTNSATFGQSARVRPALPLRRCQDTYHTRTGGRPVPAGLFTGAAKQIGANGRYRMFKPEINPINGAEQLFFRAGMKGFLEENAYFVGCWIWENYLIYIK